MQNEITIVSFHETYTGDAGSHTINTFGERYEAKAFILNNLEATNESHKEILRKDVSKKLQDSLMYGNKGRFDYTDGDHEYSIAWDFVPANSNVSDECQDAQPFRGQLLPSKEREHTVSPHGLSGQLQAD